MEAECAKENKPNSISYQSVSLRLDWCTVDSDSSAPTDAFNTSALVWPKPREIQHRPDKLRRDIHLVQYWNVIRIKCLPLWLIFAKEKLQPKGHWRVCSRKLQEIILYHLPLEVCTVFIGNTFYQQNSLDETCWQVVLIIKSNRRTVSQKSCYHF